MYSKNYYTPVIGKKKTDLIDLSVITGETPFGFFMGELDTTCPSKQNEDAMAAMGDGVGFAKYYEGVDHTLFILVNTDEYVNDILTFLAPTNSTNASLLQCSDQLC